MLQKATRCRKLSLKGSNYFICALGESPPTILRQTSLLRGGRPATKFYYSWVGNFSLIKISLNLFIAL